MNPNSVRKLYVTSVSLEVWSLWSSLDAMQLSSDSSFNTTTTWPSVLFLQQSSDTGTRRTRSRWSDKLSVGSWRFGTFCWSEFSRLSLEWNCWGEFLSSSNVPNTVSFQWFRSWHQLQSDGFGVQKNEWLIETNLNENF